MFSFLLDNMYHVHKLIYPLISRLRVSLNLIKPHLLSSHTYIYIYIYASRVENILITINLKTVYNPIHFFYPLDIIVIVLSLQEGLLLFLILLWVLKEWIIVSEMLTLLCGYGQKDQR